MSKYSLLLEREFVDHSLNQPVIGRLFLGYGDASCGGPFSYLCHTLEPSISALHPCIPTGIYKFEMRESPRFHRVLPRLLHVKGRSGILIHSGNTAKDTKGCILVGATTPVRKNFLCDSRIMLSRVIETINKYNIDTIVITEDLPF